MKNYNNLTERDWVRSKERLSWMLQDPKKTWLRLFKRGDHK